MTKKSYIRSEEHRQKMSEIKSMQKMTDVWKTNISINHADVSGNKNPNWKGGISRIEVVCLQCKASFITKGYNLKIGKGKFCSKKCDYEWRSINVRGTNHPGFTGKTNIQGQIRHSKEYKKWRLEVYERDGFTCVECGGVAGTHGSKKTILNADHITPLGILVRKLKIKLFEEAQKIPQLWDINNGRTLCEECHKKTLSYLNSSMVVGV